MWKCCTEIIHPLRWLETELLEKSFSFSLSLQGSELGSQQQDDVAKSGSNPLMVLPSGRLGEQACPLATSIIAHVKLVKDHSNVKRSTELQQQRLLFITSSVRRPSSLRASASLVAAMKATRTSSDRCRTRKSPLLCIRCISCARLLS